MRPAARAAAVLALAASLAAAPSARAGDVPTDVKESIAFFDKYAPKAKDEGKYAELVHELVSTQDPAAAERIARILSEDRSLEHQLIAADALSEFTKNAAGK